MRAYFFGNMYLSSIQQGIQAGHVIGDMFAKYMPTQDLDSSHADTVKLETLRTWADDHKTMILLNAGYGANIRSLNLRFRLKANPYPFAMFCEEEAALDGAATSIGIILPEHIYTGAAQSRNSQEIRESMEDTGEVRWFEDEELICVPVSNWELDLMQEMNKYGLAS